MSPAIVDSISGRRFEHGGDALSDTTLFVRAEELIAGALLVKLP